ncbi:hypothetical protein EV363DRAFT_1296747 [Boletus edulis]|nr:hypothetical protein EV363DRAFT_1296747 [Boletus edulis]
MPHPANGTSVCTLPKRQAQRNDIGAVTYWQSQNNLKARKKGREFGRERKVAQEKRGTESGANERGVSQKGERTTTDDTGFQTLCTLPKRQAQRNDIGAVTYWQSQNNLKARKKGREFGREHKVAQEKRGTESGANERGVSQKGERTTTDDTGFQTCPGIPGPANH